MMTTSNLLFARLPEQTTASAVPEWLIACFGWERARGLWQAPRRRAAASKSRTACRFLDRCLACRLSPRVERAECGCVGRDDQHRRRHCTAFQEYLDTLVADLLLAGPAAPGVGPL